VRYHVVLRGPRSSEAGAAQALAQAIAARYRVPVEAITERLALGGFRVKSDVDLDTAMSYAVDLTKLGGACLVVDAATGEPVEPEGRDEPVGLAAASGAMPVGLGALDRGEIVVSTLDGEVDAPEPPVAAAAPAAAAPAVTGAGQRADLEFLDDGVGGDALALDASPYEPTELASPASRDTPDQFAPPPSDATEEELLLADDPRAGGPVAGEAPRKPIILPEPSASAQPRAMRPRGPSLGERLARASRDARLSMANRGRLNFVAGVVLAVLVGFVAAHVVGAIQETGAYPPLEKELGDAYAEAVDPNTYATLPEVRAGMQILVDSRQRRIAITAALVWLATAAGFGFVWFRKIRWEALASP
jgi:hypothetical protein